MSFTAVALVLSLYAHDPGSASEGAAPAAALETEGEVREVLSGQGIKAQAVLRLDDKSELVLHGRSEVEDLELRRLAGVRIKIRGLRGDPSLPRGNHVRVEGYKILDVGGGVVPRLGTLAKLELAGKPRLIFVDDDGQAELLPDGYVGKMMRNVGARVWMVGARSGAELVPTRFGILRSPPRSAGSSTTLGTPGEQ